MISTKHASYNTFPSNSTYSDEESSLNGREDEEENENPNYGSYRNLFSYWFLGLCTDFGYWIILTGAHDLLSRGENPTNPGFVPKSSSGRECNQLSAGVILIVNIVPNVIMKSFLPFLPLCIHARTFVAIVLSVVGFSIAACNQMHLYMLSGVGLCSSAVGIWTSSFLMYLPTFNNENVIKAWCSGCGSSGFLASMAYVVLTSMGIDLSTILSCMMAIPLFMAMVFWFLMDHPNTFTIDLNENRQNHTLRKKFTEIFYALTKLFCLFTTPYFLVFFCQYLINQGLFELIYIKNSIVNLSMQVRLFTFIYLFAVLLATSVNVVKMNYLWLLAFIQAINLGLMSTESVYGWFGDSKYVFWMVAGLIFWEGLIAGVSYVNTYRRINDEIPENMRQFSMSINSVGASVGMTLAGLAAIPLHNYICNLPPP